MSSTQDPNSNVSNNQNLNSSALPNVNPVNNAANSINGNDLDTNITNPAVVNQPQQGFGNNIGNINGANTEIVNPLSQKDQTIPTTEIPMYEPEIIKDYNPYAQEPVSEPTAVVGNNFLSPLPQNSSTNNVPIDNQNNNVFASVSNTVPQTIEPRTPNAISQANQPIPAEQTTLLNQPVQQVDLPQAQAVVTVAQPVNEYEGEKKKKNIFKIIFNFIPSVILIALIVIIVIIAKNFIDKTTITDFSEIGPAIIFETEFNKSSGKLEWLLLPPTPLGLTTDAPRDFEVADKVTITCPIKSSNDLMDIVQSIINPKLGSCAFRNI